MSHPFRRPRALRPQAAPVALLGLALGLGLGPAAPVLAKGGAVALPADAGATLPATLIADNVSVQGRNILLATGHVEVFYKGNRLQADKVRYDQSAGQLDITGPLTLVDPKGQATILANSAQLSSDFQNGLLRSAQMVLDERVQIVAQQANRIDGNYTLLTNSVTSSCRVCAGHTTPLWEIRARKVIHDQKGQRLYFDQAQVRIAGVPVMYLPRLRLPDPTVKRMSGFLTPRVTGSSRLGTGITTPYFLTMGPSRDMVIAPYIGTKNAYSLGLRYREAFNNGNLGFEGALSKDDIYPSKTRGYLLLHGDFSLPRDFKLHFQLQSVSDVSYFSDYGLPQIDRLKSGVDVSRTRRDEYIDVQALHFHSIRSGEANSTLPTNVVTMDYIRRFSPAIIGGEGSLSFNALGLRRSSNEDIYGRDMQRAGITFNWRRNWLFGPGIEAAAMGQLSSDIYGIQDDSTYPNSVMRTVPTIGTEFRWPWVKAGASGASQVFEPIVQLMWSPTHVTGVPNEDSQQTEFDEGDLWSMDRFNGIDGVELGARANVGFSWTRYDPTGWTLGVTAGRVYRQLESNQFDAASGLGGKLSDWLVAVQAKWKRFSIINRTVFGDGQGIAKNELRLQWQGEKSTLATGFISMIADTDTTSTLAGANDPTREWMVDASYKFNTNWSSQIAWRYNFVDHRADGSGLKVAWRNECVSVDFSLSRSYSSSASVTPNTTFGFSVGLIGFGGVAGGNPGMCRE